MIVMPSKAFPEVGLSVRYVFCGGSKAHREAGYDGWNTAALPVNAWKDEELWQTIF